MINIEFRYKDGSINIQHDEKQTSPRSTDKFLNKTLIKNDSISFLANGYVINPENKVVNLMNADNRKEGKLIILVVTNDEDSKKQMSVIQSKGVVCPKCFEPCRIEIKNYKIRMYDCINKHVTENMKLVNYKNTQMVG